MHVAAQPRFGAHVTGYELGSGTGAGDLAALIARYRVVVFRDQRIDDAGLIAFLEGLGQMIFTAGETPVADAPMLNIVTNVGRTTPPRSVFHTDTSYVVRPPAFTALRAVALPAVGGATLFSDQVAAAGRLPAAARGWLAGRSVAHRATGVGGAPVVVRHPLFRRHPLSGDVALYLSTPERCAALSGVDAAISARVIAALYRHSIRPGTLYRHEWQTGDVVVWDNRVTMHRADHDGVVGDRVLHRGLTEGEVPIAA